MLQALTPLYAPRPTYAGAARAAHHLAGWLGRGASWVILIQDGESGRVRLHRAG